MKRMALAVLLLSFASLSIPGQSQLEAGPPPWRCGTPEPTPDEIAVFRARAEQYKNQPALTPPVANFCIPIAAHIIRKDDGTGGLPLGQLGQGLEDCNSAYANTGMHFVLLSIDYIDDSDYYFNIDTDAEIDAMIQENVVANAINVYFTPNISNEDGSLCGRGSFTTSTPQGVAMNNDCTGTDANDSTFPHELGHFFDLLHTHSTSAGAELVDGTNCSTAGDLLCDTPADPGLDEGTNINAACTYNGSETDANGDSYTPDTHQIMSYAPKLCRDYFSPDSETKVLATLSFLRPELLTIGCPPDADAGVDITAECASLTTTSVQLDGTGSSDPEGDALSYAWSATGITFDDATLAEPTGSFPEGTTTVQLVVFDGSYNDTDYVDVKIEDTTRPVITVCAADTTVECASYCGTSVDSLVTWIAGVVATDGCDGNVTITHDAPDCLPEGDTDVTFTATDDAGNDTTCVATVTVEDTTPPEIEVVMLRDVLWPPNHKMVECCATVTVTDICDDAPTFVLYGIASDEPDNDKGDGDTVDDIQNGELDTDDTCFDLRSERMGGEDGRTYTIIYQASDDADNVAYDTVSVCVPHDQSANALCSSGFLADGTGMNTNTNWFALFIPGSDALNVSTIDTRRIYVGNTAGIVTAYNTRTIDIDHDGHDDLAALFRTSADFSLTIQDASTADALVGDDAMALGTINDGPIGLHFAASGRNYLVSNIYSLGEPVEMPDTPAKDVKVPTVLGQALAAEVKLTTAISSVHPNPFNPQTNVSFTLASSGRVQIAIYDVKGSVVRRLVDETMQAGTHQTRWNGMNDAGQVATSGIYFVRMIAGSHSEVRKIVMLK